MPDDPAHLLARALQDLYRDRDDVRYLRAFADLDGDGTDEGLAYMVGPGACGSGGCTLLVIQPGAQDFRVISRHTVTQLPILASRARTNGWRDLIVHVGGGGAAPRAVALRFDGTTYPSNPTTRPASGDLAGADTLIQGDSPLHTLR